MSLVRSRKNPITGALVVADVVLRTEPDSANGRVLELEHEILQLCRHSLPRHKVPAAISFVPAWPSPRQANWGVSMRNVIVTGGSRDWAWASRKRLTGAGYRAIAVARKETPQLTSAMEEADRDHPGSLHFVPFDLAEIEDIPRWSRPCERSSVRLWARQQCGGRFRWRARSQCPTRRSSSWCAVNTLSPIVLTKYAVRAMMADGGGRIVNIASIIASRIQRSLGLRSDQGLADRLHAIAGARGRRMGVNVNAVAPGFMDTEMTQGLEDTQRQQIARRSALHRLPDVDDVANAVEFLLGDKANSITGTVLTVDAGSTA
jgi:3-oxoacyl-[acyl-carrier protein] reductase